MRFSSDGDEITGSYVDGVDPAVRHGFIATPADDDDDEDSDSDSDGD